MIPRAEMLAELMRLRYGIAIAGAHGKTTTTSMVALVLERAGLDPTAVIGGRLSAFGSNARLGRGDYMVVEADESDRSFLKLTPVDRGDHEHRPRAHGELRQLGRAAAGVRRLRQQGAVLRRGGRVRRRRAGPRAGAAHDAARHHLRLRRIAARTSPATAWRSRRSARAAASVAATPRSVDASWRRMRLRVPGRHNLLNALGAVAVGLEVGRAVRADRRGARTSSTAPSAAFSCVAKCRGVMVVDDYGHHPTEIAAVIAAARAGIDRRVVVVFQPHRYTRTRDLLDRVRRCARRRRTRSC